jgi:magnesium-transporting ATPase (P-type)
MKSLDMASSHTHATDRHISSRAHIHPHDAPHFKTPRPVPKDVCASVQGQAQCCVTGPAFQHMLQQDDLSVVETVMSNVVVFARMRSHQKGQVMDLLGERGLHQTFKGQSRRVPVSYIKKKNKTKKAFRRS